MLNTSLRGRPTRTRYLERSSSTGYAAAGRADRSIRTHPLRTTTRDGIGASPIVIAADFSWPTLHEHTTVHGRCSRVLIKDKVVLSLEDRVCSKIVIVKCFEKSRFLPRSGRNADRPIGVYF